MKTQNGYILNVEIRNKKGNPVAFGFVSGEKWSGAPGTSKLCYTLVDSADKVPSRYITTYKSHFNGIKRNLEGKDNGNNYRSWNHENGYILHGGKIINPRRLDSDITLYKISYKTSIDITKIQPV